jgi:hypothetical protein
MSFQYENFVEIWRETISAKIEQGLHGEASCSKP